MLFVCGFLSTERAEDEKDGEKIFTFRQFNDTDKHTNCTDDMFRVIKWFLTQLVVMWLVEGVYMYIYIYLFSVSGGSCG